MIENRLRLWWKSLWSEEVRSARAAVSQNFSESHHEFKLSSVELAKFDESAFVFLVFFRRSLPSRPAPFTAYEYTRESGVITELPEDKRNDYRPRAYK
jgi:hypothetical protein